MRSGVETRAHGDGAIVIAIKGKVKAISNASPPLLPSSALSSSSRGTGETWEGSLAATK